MATAANLEDQVRSISPEDEQAFMDTIDRWLERDVIPVIKEHDHGDIWPEKLVHQMAEMGLFGATIGQEYGGLGLPATTYAKIVMRISSYWMAITGIFPRSVLMRKIGDPFLRARFSKTRNQTSVLLSLLMISHFSFQHRRS